jgi:PAS domain S-box-containing protein
VKWVGTLTDVDAEQRFQQEVAAARRTSEETAALLESVLDAAPVGSVFLDRTGRVVRMNDQAAAVFGAPAENLVGTPAGTIAPALWQQCEPVFHRVVDHGEPIRNVPLIGLPAEGSVGVREWLTTFYPVRAGAGISGVGIVAVDVTERRRAERVRSAVMGQVADGVFTVDADGRLTSMNRAAARMLGWTEPEVQGRDAHDTFHYQTADRAPIPRASCILLAAATTGRVVRSAGETFTRKDGSTFPVACSAVPLQIGTAIEGLAIIFRDLTPAAGGRAIRVLIVSADERVAGAARSILAARAGVDVVEVVTAPSAAVAAAQDGHIDVAVVDGDVAGIGGIDTASRIREAAPAVRALLVVDGHDEDIVLDAIAAGCSGVLERSRAIVDLASAVEAAYEGVAFLSPADVQGAISAVRPRPQTGPQITLTEREFEVLASVSQGLSNKQVAERLGLTVNTVRNHVQRILYKLGAHSKLEAVVIARERKLGPPAPGADG